MTKELKLQNSDRTAIVDAAFHEYLSKFKWHVSSSGTIQYSYKRGYHKTKHVALASAVMGNPRKQYDHIDRNPFNNTRINLRECNKSLNEANKPKNTSRKLTSKYKGVFWDASRNKWSAQIAKDGNKYYLGRHNIEEDAARAYDVKAKELFGSFAVLNFVEVGMKLATNEITSSGV